MSKSITKIDLLLSIILMKIYWHNALSLKFKRLRCIGNDGILIFKKIEEYLLSFFVKQNKDMLRCPRHALLMK